MRAFAPVTPYSPDSAGIMASTAQKIAGGVGFNVEAARRSASREADPSPVSSGVRSSGIQEDEPQTPPSCASGAWVSAQVQ